MLSTDELEDVRRDPWAHMESLVQEGVLESIGLPGSYRVKKTKPVFATLKRVGDRWVPQCSEHPDIYRGSGGFKTPERARNCLHFMLPEHVGDDVQWEMPESIRITYTESKFPDWFKNQESITGYCSKCSNDEAGASWTNTPDRHRGDGDAPGVMQDHVRIHHDNDLVEYGPFPELHTHVWKRSGRSDIVHPMYCDCGKIGRVIEA